VCFRRVVWGSAHTFCFNSSGGLILIQCTYVAALPVTHVTKMCRAHRSSLNGISPFLAQAASECSPLRPGPITTRRNWSLILPVARPPGCSLSAILFLWRAASAAFPPAPARLYPLDLAPQFQLHRLYL
jgi:hypothetical protein